MTTKTEASASPDVLIRVLPAASATSDMPGASDPVTAAAPPTSATTQAPEPKAGTEQPPAKSGEGADKSAQGDGKGAETPPAGETKTEGDGKTKKGIGERFSEVTAQRKAAEEKAAAEETGRKVAEERADKLATDLATALEAINKVIPQAPEDVRPKRGEFDDPDKYDEALAGWAQRIGEKKAKAEAEAGFTKQREDEAKAAEADKVKAETDRVAASWKDRSDTFTKDNPDFDDVIKGDVEITTTMGQAILYSENGPKLAYHLGKNPEEAAKIAALPPAMQLMRLGALEVQLNAPPKTTKAPDPITPIGRGSNAANEKSANEMSMDEYAATRATQLRAGRPAAKG